MIRLSVRSVLLSAILLCTATAVWGGDEKLAADLRGSQPQGNVDVIVRYRGTPTEANHQRVLKGGGALRHRLDFIRSAHYSISPLCSRTSRTTPRWRTSRRTGPSTEH